MKIFNDLSLELESNFKPLTTALNELKYNASKEWKDSDGRERKRMKAELKYVYYRYSRHSPFKSWTEKERFEEAKRRAGIIDNWTESKELKTFIEDVISLEDNTDTKRALRSIRGMLQRLISHIDSVDFDAEVDGKSKYDIKKYVTIAENIPPLLEKIRELEEKADKEDLKDGPIRGNAKKGRREDPKGAGELLL